MLKASTTCPIGDTYIAKSKGPRIEPWGTPEASLMVSDLSAPTATYCDLSAMKDSIHRPTVPPMAKFVLTRVCTKDGVVDGIERGRDVERE